MHQFGFGFFSSGDFQLSQQLRRTAGAQLALAGPHTDTGTAAQIQQVIHRQAFGGIAHLTGSDRFTFTDQAFIEPRGVRQFCRAIAVTVHRRSAQRGRKGDHFTQCLFRRMRRARQRLLRRGTVRRYTKLRAHRVCRPLRHQPVSHQLAAGDREEAAQSVTFLMIQQHNPPADTASGRVVIRRHQRTDTRIRPQNTRLRHRRCQP